MFNFTSSDLSMLSLPQTCQAGLGLRFLPDEVSCLTEFKLSANQSFMNTAHGAHCIRERQTKRKRKKKAYFSHSTKMGVKTVILVLMKTLKYSLHHSTLCSFGNITTLLSCYYMLWFIHSYIQLITLMIIHTNTHKLPLLFPCPLEFWWCHDSHEVLVLLHRQAWKMAMHMPWIHKEMI